MNKKTKSYQKGGASGNPSNRSSSSAKNENNSNLELRFSLLKMPDVPGVPVKIPKSYKLPDFAYFMVNIERNLPNDQMSHYIYLELKSLISTKHKNAYDLLFEMTKMCDTITEKTDTLFLEKKKLKNKDITEKWITFFYRLKILILDEKEKLLGMIKHLQP